MGENEQGGMLRVVIVLGLIAIISFVVIAAVLTQKAQLRRNIVYTTQLNQNLIVLHQNTDKSNLYMFHGVGLTTGQPDYDETSNTFTLKLAADAAYGGMYYGEGGAGASSHAKYDAFQPDDTYVLSADIRTDSSALVSKMKYALYFESSSTTMQTKPDLSSTWQHYETKGVRLTTWGAPYVYFENHTGQVVTVQVRNVEMHREIA